MSGGGVHPDYDDPLGHHDSLETGGLDYEEAEAGDVWLDPPGSQIVIQIFYAIICLIGLPGNTLVIYVVGRFSKIKTQVTNLYIVNLAIADVCFLVGIPFLMTTFWLGSWPFGTILCKAYFTTTSISQITSSMFLLIIAADRYLTVCHPIAAPKWRTPFIATTVVLTAWIISALINIPIFKYANTLEIDKECYCNIFWPESGSMSGEMIFVIYSFVLGFALPFLLIAIFYALVIWRLRTVWEIHTNISKSTSVQKDSQQVEQQTDRGNKEMVKSHRRVTKMVLIIIAVHFLCWAPYWATHIALILMPHDSSHSGTMLIIYLLAGCLSYSNATMNPFLYAFLSDGFKKSFKKAFAGGRRKETNATLPNVKQQNSICEEETTFLRQSPSPRQRKSRASTTTESTSAALTTT